ncbi:hypothetical protein RSAG8_12934, partial [Rhizoctonia solani AG-8 WAC10335]
MDIRCCRYHGPAVPSLPSQVFRYDCCKHPNPFRSASSLWIRRFLARELLSKTLHRVTASWI